MKIIKLNISERLFALKYLDSFKGTVSLLSKVMDSVKSFGISPEEWEKADRKITKGADGEENWAWDNEKAGVKDVEADEDVFSFLKISIDKQEKEEGFGLADRAVIDLRSKIEEALK